VVFVLVFIVRYLYSGFVRCFISGSVFGGKSACFRSSGVLKKGVHFKNS
jgi:hypothetical protein